MRIGPLAGGGDAPGLDAAIRAVVLRADAVGRTVVGVHDGWLRATRFGDAAVDLVEEGRCGRAAVIDALGEPACRRG